MPTDTNLTVGGTKRLPTMQEPTVLEAVVDYAVNPSGADDTCKVINIPAGTTVVSVTASVETVEGAGDTFDVGDNNGDTQFLTATSANALACTLAAATTAKTYTAANAIVINSNAALTAAKIRITALCYRAGSPD